MNRINLILILTLSWIINSYAFALSTSHSPGLIPACEIQAFVTNSATKISTAVNKFDDKKTKIFQENIFKFLLNKFRYPRTENEKLINEKLKKIVQKLTILDGKINVLLASPKAQDEVLLLRVEAHSIDQEIEYLTRMIIAYEQDQDIKNEVVDIIDCQDNTEKSLANQCRKITESLPLVAEIDLNPKRCQEWLELRNFTDIKLPEKKEVSQIELRDVKLKFTNDPKDQARTNPNLDTKLPHLDTNKPIDNNPLPNTDLGSASHGLNIPLPIGIPSKNTAGKPTLNVLKKPKEGQNGNEKKPGPYHDQKESGEIAEYKKDIEEIFGNNKNKSNEDNSQQAGNNPGNNQSTNSDQDAINSLTGLGNGENIKIGRYFLESEFKDNKEKNIDEYNNIKSILKNNLQKYSSLIDRNGKNWAASVDSILNDLTLHYTNNGQGKSELTKDIFKLNGGNKTAKAKVILSALKDAGLDLPGNLKLGVQETSDGFNPVIIDLKTGDISALGNFSLTNSSKIYTPELLVNNDLVSRGITTGLSKENFEIGLDKNLNTILLRDFFKNKIDANSLNLIQSSHNGSGGLNNCSNCSESTFDRLSSNYFDQIKNPNEWVNEKMNKSLSYGIPWIVEYESGARSLPDNVIAKSQNTVILFKNKTDFEAFEKIDTASKKLNFLSKLQLRGLAKYSNKFETVTNLLNKPMDLAISNLDHLDSLIPINPDGNPDFKGLQFIGRQIKGSIRDLPLEDKRNQDADDWKDAIKKSIYADDDYSKDKIEKILSLDPKSREALKAQTNFLNNISKNPEAILKALKILPDEKSRQAMINLTIYTVQNRVPELDDSNFSKYLNPTWALIDQGKVKLRDGNSQLPSKDPGAKQIKWIGTNHSTNGNIKDTKKTNFKEIELTQDSIAQLMRLSTYGSRWHNLEYVPTYGWEEKREDTNFRGVTTNGKGFTLWTEEISRYLVDHKIPVGHGIFKIYPLIVKNRFMNTQNIYIGPKGDLIPQDLALIMDQVASQACPNFWGLSEDSKDCIKGITDQESEAYIKNLTKTHFLLKQKK